MKKIRMAFVVLLVSAMVLGGAGVDICSAYYDKDGKSDYGHKDEIHKKAKVILSNKTELGLTDEQAAKIKALKLKTKKDIIKRKAEIDLVAVDLRAQKRKDPVDTKAVHALIDKKYELKKEKAKYSMAAYVELKGILTAEQKSKLKEIYGKCKKDK